MLAHDQTRRINYLTGRLCFGASSRKYMKRNVDTLPLAVCVLLLDAHFDACQTPHPILVVETLTEQT
jgi:hypothetical protein